MTLIGKLSFLVLCLVWYSACLLVECALPTGSWGPEHGSGLRHRLTWVVGRSLFLKESEEGVSTLSDGRVPVGYYTWEKWVLVWVTVGPDGTVLKLCEAVPRGCPHWLQRPGDGPPYRIRRVGCPSVSGRGLASPGPGALMSHCFSSRSCYNKSCHSSMNSFNINILTIIQVPIYLRCTLI